MIKNHLVAHLTLVASYGSVMMKEYHILLNHETDPSMLHVLIVYKVLQ
jgi:hypothetical protein